MRVWLLDYLKMNSSSLNRLNGMMSTKAADVWYNIADAINKIGFGLVVYSIAISESNKK